MYPYLKLLRRMKKAKHLIHLKIEKNTLALFTIITMIMQNQKKMYHLISTMNVEEKLNP